MNPLFPLKVAALLLLYPPPVSCRFLSDSDSSSEDHLDEEVLANPTTPVNVRLSLNLNA